MPLPSRARPLPVWLLLAALWPGLLLGTGLALAPTAAVAKDDPVSDDTDSDSADEDKDEKEQEDRADEGDEDESEDEVEAEDEPEDAADDAHGDDPGDDHGDDRGGGDERDDEREHDDDRHADRSDAEARAAGDGAAGADVDDDAGREFEPDVLVALEPSRAARAELLRRGYRIVDEQRFAALGLTLLRLEPPGGLDLALALAELRRLDPAGTYDYDAVYRPAADTGCRGVRCEPARQVRWNTGCAVEARIGLLDGAVSAATAALPAERIVRARPPADSPALAHGSAVATLLVGQAPDGAAPLLPKARLFSVDAFAATADGPGSRALELARGLDWLVAQRVDVINAALAGPDNAVVHETVRRVVAGGIPVVAAAGNLGPQGPARYPAAWPEVIAVTAVDQAGRPYGQANRGAYVDLAAPGVSIWSADAQGRGQFYDGTSFATPFVSAAVAVLRAQDRRRTPAELQRELERSARDLGAAGHDPVFGAGLLQAPACPAAGAP